MRRDWGWHIEAQLAEEIGFSRAVVHGERRLTFDGNLCRSGEEVFNILTQRHSDDFMFLAHLDGEHGGCAPKTL